MSGLVLTSLYRYITGLELDVDGQIKEYHHYWINVNNPKWRKEQEKKYLIYIDYMNTFNIGDTLVQHRYYKRNCHGMLRINTEIETFIKDKRERELLIEIISFGSEPNKSIVYDEISCSSDSCLIIPYSYNWKNKNNE